MLENIATCQVGIFVIVCVCVFFFGACKGKGKTMGMNLHPNCNWRLVSFGFNRDYNPKYPTRRGNWVGWVDFGLGPK